MHQSTTPSLSQTIWPRWASRHFLSLPIVETLIPMTFGYSLSLEAIVMRQLRWKRLWQRSLTRSRKRTSMGPSRSCWNGTTSALQPEEITSKGTILIHVYIYSNTHKYTHVHILTRVPTDEPFPVVLGCRIHRLLLCSGVLPHCNECHGYDTKQSDGEALVMPELWRMRSNPSLSSLPNPLWSKW